MQDLVLFELGWATRSIFVVLCAYGATSVLSGVSGVTRNFIWRVCLLTVLCIPLGMAITAKVGFTLRLKPAVGRLFPSPLVSAEPAVTLSPGGVPPNSGPTMPRGGMPPQGMPQGGMPLVGMPLVGMPPDSPVGLDIWTRLGILYAIGFLAALGMQVRTTMRRHSAQGSHRDSAWQMITPLVVAMQWMNPAIWLMDWNLRQSDEERIGAAGIRSQVPNQSWRPTNLVASYVAFGVIGICLAAIGSAPLPLPRSLSPLVLNPPIGDPKPAGPNDKDQFGVGAKPVILFVGNIESSDLPTWDMDGGLTKPGLPTKLGFGYGGTANQGQRGVVVAFSIPGLPAHRLEEFPSSLGLAAKLGGQRAVQNSGNFDPQVPKFDFQPTKMAQPQLAFSKGGVYTGEVGFLVPASWRSADLELGIGTGSYRKTGEWVDGKGNFELTVERKSGTNIVGDGPKAKTTSYPISVLSMGRAEDANVDSWRLVAYDGNGREIPIVMPPQPAVMPGNIKQTFVGIASVAPDKIHKIDLEQREMLWVKIKNVPLYPGGQKVLASPLSPIRPK